MPKLNEIRDKLAENYSITPQSRVAFRIGFDAAIELGLAVKFAEWFEYESRSKYGMARDYDYTTTELFQYWIENVWEG